MIYFKLASNLFDSGMLANLKIITTDRKYWIYYGYHKNLGNVKCSNTLQLSLVS